MARKGKWYEPYGYEEEYEYVSRQTQYDDAFAKSESNDKKEFEDIDELFDIVANKLFASVTYDKTNNKLCFYSEKGDLIGSIKMDDIVPTQIIKDAYYDASTQELVIIFENDKEVRISLSDLVDIYEAGDGLEAVEKQDPSGNTTTYFQVKIDAESDEFLTVSEDGVKLSGVKNAIDAETARATAVEEELAAIASATTQGLDEEIARAKAAEAELQGAIDAEAERAQAAEETLTEAIADEADRAQAAEEALEASIESAVTQGIAAEVERAQAAEAELQDAIDAEVARATSAESALTEAVADEIARATEEEGVLAEAIDTESARIDGVAESLATETNRATSAETAIQNAINNEIERATAVEADLQEAIESALTKQVVESVVGSSSINVDDTDLSNPVLSAKVSQEVEDGKSNLIKINTDGLYAGVDLLYDDLTNTLTFKTTTASKDINLLSNSVIDRIYYNSADETIVIEYTVNGKKMPDVVVPVSDLITEIDVSSTTSVRMTKTVHSVSGTDYIYAEVILDNNHDDNIAQIDNGLYVPGAQIAENTQAISAEIARAQAAESALTEAIADEADRATAAEEALEASIESAVTQGIAAEVARAQAAEGGLQDAIDAEAARATIAESALTEAIAAEADRATAAEEALGASIESAVTQGIAAEVARATSAETALGEEIDAITPISGNGIVVSESQDGTVISTKFKETSGDYISPFSYDENGYIVFEGDIDAGDYE